MFVQLTMTMRFLILVGAVIVNAELTPLPALVLFLVLASATLLIPALCWLALVVARVLSPVPHGPPGLAPPADCDEVRTPTDPGTPGAVQARAPSLGVHAFA